MGTISPTGSYDLQARSAETPRRLPVRRHQLRMLRVTLEAGHMALPRLLGTFTLQGRERFVRAAQHDEVKEEVWQRFRFTMKQFHEKTKELYFLQPLSWAPLAASALASGVLAKAGPSAPSSVAKPGPMRIHRVAASTAVPRITDTRSKQFNRTCRRAGFLSHTDRYKRDLEYRATCEQNGTPEWLQRSNGSWVRQDGTDDRA